MRIDSSESKVYLTASNNQYERPHKISNDPEILADIRRRNDRLKERRPPQRTGPSLLRSLRQKSQFPKFAGTQESTEVEEGAMATANDVLDVNALPESSDEEELFSTALSKAASLPTPENTQTTKKRALAETNGNTRASMRSKRAKFDNKPSSQPLQSSDMNTIPGSQGSDWLSQPQSQSSQKRRNNIKFGKKKASLYNPNTIRESPEREVEAGGLSIPGSIASTPNSRLSKNSPAKLELPEVSSSPSAPVQLFLPKFDETQHGSGIDDDIPPTSDRRRRGSSSSLSSYDSLASVQLDKATKRRLNADADLIAPASDTLSGYVRCPRCKRDTLAEGLSQLKGGKDVNKLSHKESQKFCYDHRIRDAKQVWADSHYPDSSLETLTSATRVEKYLSNLVPILQRKRKSFYLDKLDKAISGAKGNQGKLNKFFTTDVMTFTHHGYYGARGAKRLALAIASDEKITKQFRRAEKSDKAFRSANFARATDSILLPELLVMLILDDMYLTHDEDGEAQARKILEDSEDIGMLLNGDDNDEVNDTKENGDAV